MRKLTTKAEQGCFIRGLNQQNKTRSRSSQLESDIENKHKSELHQFQGIAKTSSLRNQVFTLETIPDQKAKVIELIREEMII